MLLFVQGIYKFPVISVYVMYFFFQRPQEESEDKSFKIIEWNNKSVWIAQCSDSEAIFCRKPIGKISETGTFIPSNVPNGFILNDKDIQALDNDFVITSFKSKIQNGKILVDFTEMIEIINKNLKSYLNKDDSQ